MPLALPTIFYTINVSAVLLVSSIQTYNRYHITPPCAINEKSICWKSMVRPWQFFVRGCRAWSIITTWVFPLEAINFQIRIIPQTSQNHVQTPYHRQSGSFSEQVTTLYGWSQDSHFMACRNYAPFMYITTMFVFSHLHPFNYRCATTFENPTIESTLSQPLASTPNLSFFPCPDQPLPNVRLPYFPPSSFYWAILFFPFQSQIFSVETPYPFFHSPPTNVSNISESSAQSHIVPAPFKNQQCHKLQPSKNASQTRLQQVQAYHL